MANDSRSRAQKVAAMVVEIEEEQRGFAGYPYPVAVGPLTESTWAFIVQRAEAICAPRKARKAACRRCKGTGVVTMYSHVEGGRCFACTS